MYLSKVLVKAPMCRNPYDIHRALWGLFPDDAHAKRDFLFRIEQSNYSHTEILMQSVRQPTTVSDIASIVACKAYRPVFTLGHQLRFLVVANPIKMVNDESGRKNARGEIKKCRVPLLREDELRAWIERKLSNAASMRALAINTSSPIKFKKTEENRLGKIQPVVFKGILEVQVPESLMTFVKAGIGPAKAFGCGLISLARM